MIAAPPAPGLAGRWSRHLSKLSVVLALVLMAAIVAAGVLLLQRERAGILRLAAANADHLARQVATETATLALLGDVAALAAAGSVFHHRRSPVQLGAELEATAIGLPGIQAAVYDARAAVLGASRRFPAVAAAWLEETLVAHRDGWREMLVSPGDALVLSNVLAVSRARWEDDGAFLGFSVALVDLGRLADWAREQRATEAATVAVYLSDGRRVALLEGDEPHTSTEALLAGLDARWSVDDGAASAEPVVAGIGMARDLPVVGLVEIGKADLLAPWRRNAAMGSAGAAVLLAAALLFLAVYMRAERSRAAAERSLRISEERLAAALDNGNLSLWDWAVDRGEVLFGDRLAAMLGRLAGDPPPTVDEFRALMHPADREAVLAALQAHVRGETEVYAAHFRVARAGGGWAWIADRGRAVDRGPDGTARRVIGVHADITALKEAEEALQEKSRALADSNRELEQFAYIASHDLQEPLRMVSSFLSLLLRREGTRLTDEGRSFAETAMDGAKRMSRLIHDLLDYSRIGTRGAAFEPVETAEVVAEALGNLKMAAADAGAVLEVQPDPPAVLGDRGQIVRLVQNLVGNALKYRAPDRPPHVRIGWSRTAPGRLHLTVADNGIGIAAEHYDTVFQIFSRLHSGSEYEGTGIGLAVCRRIVDRHGGRIWIDSVPGQGSTFHVDLPLAAAEARSTAAE